MCNTSADVNVVAIATMVSIVCIVGGVGATVFMLIFAMKKCRRPRSRHEQPAIEMTHLNTQTRFSPKIILYSPY